MASKFYLYRLYHDEETLYIGKGTGRRLTRQKRCYALNGEIIAHLSTEAAAYKLEKKLIAEHQPRLNMCAGGGGGVFGARQIVVWPNAYTEEGLQIGGKQIARLVAIWNKDKSLNGILSIINNFVSAHGMERASEAIVPHLRRLLLNDLALENSK